MSTILTPRWSTVVAFAPVPLSTGTKAAGSTTDVLRLPTVCRNILSLNTLIWQGAVRDNRVQLTAQAQHAIAWRRLRIERSQEALAHGTLLCSAQQYAEFIQHLSRNQRFPPLVSLAQVEADLYWARGWGVDRSTPDTVYWHWGNDTYFQNFACYAPQRDLGLVIMTNSQNGLKLIEALFPRLWGQSIQAVHWCQ